MQTKEKMIVEMKEEIIESPNKRLKLTEEVQIREEKMEVDQKQEEKKDAPQKSNHQNKKEKEDKNEDKRPVRDVETTVLAVTTNQLVTADEMQEWFAKFQPVKIKVKKIRMHWYRTFIDFQLGSHDARDALNELRDKEFKGQKLRMSYFNYIPPEPSRNIVIRNLPSSTTEKEINQMYGDYGIVEDIKRIHKKATDETFVYVLFQSVESAIVAQRNPISGHEIFFTQFLLNWKPKDEEATKKKKNNKRNRFAPFIETPEEKVEEEVETVK